jgi:aubergine-like protein
VNKTVSSRFYIKENNEIVNPPSGSVIVEPLSKDNAYDFHLAAQFVAKGSCNPTQYRVAYESEEKIPQEAVISFTYEQCFNYFNWEGAVRVPACLQYADKLAYQVGEKIKENIPKGENQFTMHYL